MPVIVQKRVTVANRQHNIQPPQLVQRMLIGQIRDKVAGGVKIDLLIIMSIKQVAEMLDLQGQIITSAQRRDLAERLRMPAGKIDRMERTETATM